MSRSWRVQRPLLGVILVCLVLHYLGLFRNMFFSSSDEQRSVVVLGGNKDKETTMLSSELRWMQTAVAGPPTVWGHGRGGDGSRRLIRFPVHSEETRCGSGDARRRGLREEGVRFVLRQGDQDRCNVTDLDAGVCIKFRKTVHCAPVLIVAGAMKAGTGLFRDFLRVHPRLETGKGFFKAQKEMNFFNSYVLVPPCETSCG